MADALFGEPRLAAIYDAVEGERRGDLDHYLAIADELGARIKPSLEAAGLWSDAYVGDRHAWFFAVLELLRPRLAPTAVIAADMSVGNRDHDRYRAYVSDPDGGLIATELQLDAGLVIATPTTA